MVTPYDWQEAIGHRAQFVESRLASGVPVLAMSVQAGIVAATFRRQTSKIFEVYDRLMYAAVGQQSDIESLRVAAIDFAHREGFQRSEQDVSIQRIVTAMSQPIKDAFANFSSAPWIGRALFMEVGDSVETDKFYCIDYEGDYCTERQRACLSGTTESNASLTTQLDAIKAADLKPREAALKMRKLLEKSMSENGQSEEGDSPDLNFEAFLLARNGNSDRRFERLTEPDV